MFKLPNLHLHVMIVCFAISCQRIDKASASQPLHFGEWQQEILPFDGVAHVEPFRADRTELLVLVVQPLEPRLEVQELQVHFEGV